MEVGCYVEVDVNGEEVFWVDKGILSSFSGKWPNCSTNCLSLDGLPGGAEAFELITRFCYNNGRVDVTPSNTCLLHFAAHFMEMETQSEKSLQGISNWTGSEILAALRQCQDYFPIANSTGVFDRVLDSLVGRINSAMETSPSNSSPESSAFRFSFDTRSSTSARNSSCRPWWFEDLTVFNSDTIEKIVNTMLAKKTDHCAISRFLFHYLRSKTSNAASDERRKTMAVVINLLYSLHRASVSCKVLFGILRLSSTSNLTEICRARLDGMIGCRIDQATLDNILVPSPAGAGILYDVDLVLSFLKSFLESGGRSDMSRLKRAGCLMDLYLAEVAPDPGLKPLKFMLLTMALPDVARDYYDGVYQAIDMYLKVHVGLSEQEKMKICSAINYEKLSSETCKHLMQNPDLPLRIGIQALISQQSKIRSLIQEPKIQKKSIQQDPPQLVLYAEKVNLSTENEKLRSNLQGIQWRVIELEKICKRMHTQVKTKIMRSAGINPSAKNVRSLPKLCSGQIKIL